MKNADMPAMPVMNNEQSFPLDMERYGSKSASAQFAFGLTKREMMAMHAPEMPDWFDSQWRNEHEDDEMYFKEEEDEWGSTYLQITKHGVKAMYFAWLINYADELLAELERTCHKT